MTQPATTYDELKRGDLLGGKYRLITEIGRGAMGTVWSAIHESLDQRVAIKVISPEHAGSEELRKRFDTEARAAAKLRSRFVVGVSDNGLTDDGVPYIVMEYLEGECLEDRIARHGCLSLADTARVARHVSRALSRAHASGIIHRDLKPANVFMAVSEDDEDGEDWTAKVLDFGIAKMDDFGDRSTTKTGTVLGTPLFMSPEQVRGSSDVDTRADLYSFGMMIYNMLTGTYAFEGQSFGDLLVSICTDPLPQLSRFAPHAPPSLDAWFQKACAREPSERYQTASDFLAALSSAIGEGSASAALSTTDLSASIEHPAPHLVAPSTLTANTVASSGISRIDTGASAHTVNEAPRKSRIPFFIATALLVVGVTVLGITLADDGPEIVVGVQEEALSSSAVSGGAPKPEAVDSRKEKEDAQSDVPSPRQVEEDEDVVPLSEATPSPPPQRQLQRSRRSSVSTRKLPPKGTSSSTSLTTTPETKTGLRPSTKPVPDLGF